MIARESVKNRLDSEHGISLHRVQLHAASGPRLPLAARPSAVRAADRWFRPVGQPRVGRRPDPTHAFGARSTPSAWPLLLASDGSKLGKTTGARMWLDAEKTSPYQFHQHFVNLSDVEVAQQLPMFSLRPVERGERQILAEHAAAPEKRARRSARWRTRSPHSSTVTAAAERRTGRGRGVVRRRSAAGHPAVLEAVGREVPASRMAKNETARSVLHCWSQPVWPARRATRGGCSSRAASGSTGRRSTPPAVSTRPRRSTGSGCWSRRDGGHTISSRFFVRQVDAPSQRG